MLKPVNDFITLEEYKYEEIDGIEFADIIQGELYRVIAAGPGYITDAGRVIPMECKPGDVVVVVGKILKVYDRRRKLYLIARGGDVVAIAEKYDDAGDSQKDEGEQCPVGKGDESTGKGGIPGGAVKAQELYD